MDDLGIDNSNISAPTTPKTPKTSPKKRTAKQADDDNDGQADGDGNPPTPSPKKMKTPRKMKKEELVDAIKKEESFEPEGLLGDV